MKAEHHFLMRQQVVRVLCCNKPITFYKLILRNSRPRRGRQWKDNGSAGRASIHASSIRCSVPTKLFSLRRIRFPCLPGFAIDRSRFSSKQISTWFDRSRFRVASLGRDFAGSRPGRRTIKGERPLSWLVRDWG